VYLIHVFGIDDLFIWKFATILFFVLLLVFFICNYLYTDISLTPFWPSKLLLEKTLLVKFVEEYKNYRA